MKSVGLIVEYNPFHNGHLYHLQQSKKLANADVVIIVMSGHFTQRGEPTVVSKWQRTQMALLNGADLVVELPYLYSTQHASMFALGAISILNHLNVDTVVFGSECGSLEQLENTANLMKSATYNERFQSFLSDGFSVPRASEKALQSLQLSPYLASPNDTLGIHYLNAAKTLNATLSLQTIKRIHSTYHEATPSHEAITSATSVRAMRKLQQSYDSYVPSTVSTLLAQDESLTQTCLDYESYFPFLKQKILTLTPRYLQSIHDITEGLENRLYEAMMQSFSFSEFVERVKTKRYTVTRIQRICAHILTHTTKEMVNAHDLAQGAPYIRILGTSGLGRTYLKQIKKSVTIPLYSTFSTREQPMLAHELAVTAAYCAPLPVEVAHELMRREYAQVPLHVEANMC